MAVLRGWLKEEQEMSKWENGNRRAKLGRQDSWTGKLAHETMVYLTECAAG